MKRFNKAILFISFLAIAFTGFAQAPNLLNYQAVARNSVGNPLPNQKMNLRLSIHNFSSTGSVVYTETRSITTNAGGLFSVQIGSAGTTASTGTLSGVNWLDGDKFLQVEIDPDANNNYSNLGNVQLISVPYALSSVSATTAVTANKLSGLNASVATLNNVSGTNTGDNAVNSLYAGLVSNATHSGDAEGSTALTVKGINGTPLSGLSTGILKNTTVTGVPSIAVAGSDYLSPTGSAAGLTNFPTLNQNTTGNAATASKLAAPKNINGIPFDGSADITISASVDVNQLTGTTLNSTITGSSLTSVGTLNNLTVTNPIVGNVNGNASTATKLSAPKNINGIPFDGTADITISASADAGTLTGTTLKPTVTNSSLTSVGTLTNLTVTNPIAGSVNGNAATATKLAAPKNINGVPFDGSNDITISASADAGTLTGTSLNSTITSSSLTSVGTLANLTVINPIAGSINGNASTATKLSAPKNINGIPFDGSTDITISASADAGTLTGTTLNSTITSSGLTSVGTLANLTVTNPIAGSINGNAATATTAGNITATSNSTLTTLSNLSSVGTITSGVWSGTTLSIEKGGTGLTSAGSNGQVLTSTGSGTLSWTTVSAGGSGIPYTGATAAVDLGAYDLKVNGLTIGRGSGNTAAGSEALKNNTTGYDNTANGFQALKNNTTGNRNTANGMSALLSNTTGQVNTAIGYLALTSNTEGSWNTANGIGALQLNTTGGFNTAIGTNSLLNNNGNYNIAMGSASLQGNTSGASNVAIGFNTNSSNTSGNNNTAVGNGSLGTNTTGSNNTALGLGADVATSNLSNATAIGYTASVAASNTIQLGNTSIDNVKTSGTITAGTVTYPKAHGTSGQVLSTTGTGTLTWTTVSGGSAGIPYTGATGAVNLGAYDLKVNGLTVGEGGGSDWTNTSVGANTLNANTTGVNNTAIGSYTLGQNTTGSYNTVIGREAMTSNIAGSFNTAIGTSSLGYNNGEQNTAVGRGSLGRNTSGNYNTGIGDVALYMNTTGINNTALGLTALSVNETGSNNTAIGAEANVTAVGLNNTTAIGYRASVSADNTIQLGNTNVVNVKTSGTITAGTITYPNTHGTSGQVLTTLGSGMLSWTTAQNASDTSSLSNRINAVNLGLNNKLNVADTSNMFFGYKTAINNKLNIIDTTAMLSSYLRKYDNATTATLAGNITATTNTTLTSLVSLNTVGTITSGTISLTTNISTTGTLKAGTITYPNTAGTSGYYLKTDGTGTATWAAVSGGSSGVPYTGATGAVNLGAYDLKVQGLTIGLGNGTTTSNTAFGLNVLKSATTGYDNTAMGKDALYTNTSGTSNVAIGTVALYLNSTGGENSAFGNFSLYNNTGSFNTGIGMHALETNTTGTHNTAIGVWANVTSGGLTNATAIGYNAQATASNMVRIGNASVSVIQGQVGWTAASDLRIKKNITNTNYGLSTVMQLRPVEYNLISNDLKQVGFIAQEVKKLVPEVVTGKEGDLKKGEILGITYANLVPVLTKAIQEQQAIIDIQNKRLSELESLVKKLAATK